MGSWRKQPLLKALHFDIQSFCLLGVLKLWFPPSPAEPHWSVGLTEIWWSLVTLCCVSSCCSSKGKRGFQRIKRICTKPLSTLLLQWCVEIRAVGGSWWNRYVHQNHDILDGANSLCFTSIGIQIAILWFVAIKIGCLIKGNYSTAASLERVTSSHTNVVNSGLFASRPKTNHTLTQQKASVEQSCNIHILHFQVPVAFARWFDMCERVCKAFA